MNASFIYASEVLHISYYGTFVACTLSSRLVTGKDSEHVLFIVASFYIFMKRIQTEQLNVPMQRGPLVFSSDSGV